MQVYIQSTKVFTSLSDNILVRIQFSVVATMKTKYRSTLMTGKETRDAISLMTPRSGKPCAEEQAHPSK
jgi:hypothetical protein